MQHPSNNGQGTNNQGFQNYNGIMGVSDQGLMGSGLPQHLQHMMPGHGQLLNQQQAAQIH
jgi:hypothetical protein